MRYAIVAALSTVVLVCGASVHAAEIYWDTEKQYDAQIDPKKFDATFTPDNPAKSFEQMEVYDKPSIETEPAAPPAPVVRRTLPMPPAPRTRIDTTPTRRPRDPVTRPVDEPRLSRPQPEPEPGVSVDTAEPKSDTPIPQLGGGSNRNEKKLQWGNVQVKPAEPKSDETKLRWGR